MAQQTAVEWLVKELAKQGHIWVDSVSNLDNVNEDDWDEDFLKIYKQAKQMEKEQIANAWDIGRRDIDYPMNGERYYNEIYTQSGTE